MSDAGAFSIRPLGPEDHDFWLPLWRGYLEFYHAQIAPEITALTFSRLCEKGEPMDGALAWRGGEAIGLVHFIRHRSCWTAGDYCYLQDLFVSQSVRGGGVGRLLIEHVYATAASLGCSRVHWLTHDTNTDAMKLYDRIGDRSGFVQYRKLFV